ncbi:MAG: M28 family peptidase [Gemmataceae bacterium]|nr:M28 family peptidase [Gemmataceae bacterium]
MTSVSHRRIGSRQAAVLMLALLSLAGCVPVASTGDSEESTALASARDTFAADQEPTPTAAVPFDGKRAIGYLEDVCKFGPRISGTDGMKKQQEFLKGHFEKHGAKVAYQKFMAKQESQKKPIEMANMIVSWFPDQQRRIIICAHYDTRPIADQEPDPRDWRLPFLSANDGGSGVALMMELAHHMKDLKTQVGVDFVFFDGEEYVFDKRDHYFFGSEHFAKNYRQTKPKHVYLGAILLDMVGGKGAKFPKEPNSSLWAGDLVEQVWKIAQEQKCTAFQQRRGDLEVNDDHIALNKFGRIPAIDIIDFDYEHWHKLTDVPSKCSADSLEQVAKVLGVWMQRVK